MSLTFEDLKSKTVAELRQLASDMEGHPIQGYTQMNKEHLLEAICDALNLDMHVHHEIVGINKRRVKRKIKALKIQRDKAIAAGNKKDLKEIRREIHLQKRKLRKAMI